MTSRRLLIAGGAAALFAGPADAIPLRIPFGGRKKPAVDLAAIIASTGAPGMAAAVVTPKGFAFRGAVGKRRIGERADVTVDDLWLLGSNTKALTAALYARLVETGRAAWGARLSRLLPDLKLHEAWSETRIDDLLAHRSGVSDVGVIDADFLAAARASRLAPRAQRTELAQRVLAEPPRRPPGGFEYANLNYVLAGAAIERITNRPWEGAMAANLFKPLGLTQVGFGAPIGPSPWGHRRGEDGKLVSVDPEGVADNPVVLAPAGGVHASLDDYARFIRLFVNEGGKTFAPETLARLARPWSGGDGQYGMGWQVFTDRAWADGPLLTHEGTNSLWHASVQVAPAKSLAFIALANAEEGGGVQACARAQQALVRAFA